MVTKENIIKLPNKRLRNLSKNVDSIDNKIKKIIKDMSSATISWEKSRRHEIGVALAAVQINKLYKIVIVKNDYENKEDLSFKTYINPEIVKKYGDIVEDYEGCLSVPDIYGKIPRFSKVKVKYIDLEGGEHQEVFTDFMARIMQHEIDHTQGILFIDKIKDREDAFYILDKKGNLISLDYESKIKKNTILW